MSDNKEDLQQQPLVTIKKLIIQRSTVQMTQRKYKRNPRVFQGKEMFRLVTRSQQNRAALQILKTNSRVEQLKAAAIKA